MGIALGGSFPVLLSYLGDAFESDARGRATAALTICTAGGGVIGQSIAGFTAPVYGWRIPFAIVAVLTLISIFIFALFAKEPVRGGGEKLLKNSDGTLIHDNYDETLNLKKVKAVLSSPSIVINLMNGLLFSIPLGFITTFGQVFLQDEVGPQVPGGISTQVATSIVLALSLSAGVGTLTGGYYTDVFWRRNKILVPLFAGFTVIIGVIPFFIFGNIIMPLYGYFLTAIPAGFIVSLGATTKNPMLLNTSIPETRGTVFALNTIVDDVGKAAGTFVLAVLIGVLGGRREAFNFALGLWILSSLFFFLLILFLKRDVAKVDAHMIKFRDRQLEAKNNQPQEEETSSTAVIDTSSPVHATINVSYVSDESKVILV